MISCACSVFVTKRSILTFVCAATASGLLTSCTLPRRKALRTVPFNQTLATRPPDNLVISFEQSVKGKPLSETVWDNISGPLWDAKESKRIGFTEHYRPQFYAIPPASLPAAAESGVHLIDSRLMIPFGKVFSRMFESAVRKYCRQPVFCYGVECQRECSGHMLFAVKIDRFFVWEAPVNHLNLY